MGHYYYRGKKYTKRENKAWRTIKRVANRAFDAMHGNHPGGAEALVDRMIEQFPEKPRQAEPPAPLPDPTASLEPDPKE